MNTSSTQLSTPAGGIDFVVENLLSTVEAAKFVGARRGRRPINQSTIWRWCMHGVRGVRLESICIGGTRVTSTEALQRFFERLAERSGHGSALAPTPVGSSFVPSSSSSSRRNRERRRAKAEKELERRLGA